MVDFKKHIDKKAAPDLTDPLKLFETLDRKTSHTTLRPAQKEALAQLHARRGEKDLVLKMPTGTGKSTVGLLWARARMSENKRPGVYLCPTKQLVEQVLDEATRVKIRAHAYPGGERHPHEECLAGEAVLVCTYDKLFNAKSTFDRTDVRLTPEALVLDDAHAGIEVVRQHFTLACSEASLRKALYKVLDGALRAYQPGYWSDIRTGRRETVLEVPYWLWHPLFDEVHSVLSAAADTDDLKFQWPWVRDVLRWCRCVVAADGVEILPDILPVRLARAYDSAPHRLFMSATLADDAVLVRELACSGDAARKPVVAGTDSGMGERMVLVPSLIDKALDRNWLMSWAKTRAKSRVQVVVLAASEKSAREWETSGAKVATGDEVTPLVDALRREEVHFAAFAQRYDGIDLPDDACRLLIIDGMPTGQSITDRYDTPRLGAHAGVRNSLAYRIEQGMGRAVRSNADYAVVILSGPELASFTARSEVRDLLGTETRAQLELGRTLASLAREDGAEAGEAFGDLVDASLKRDANWKRYYDENVRAVVKPLAHPDEVRIAVAEAERSAATAALAGDSSRAVVLLREVLDGPAAQVEDDVRGRLLQSIASYLHEADPAEAVQVQKAAYDNNPAMFKPPTGAVARPPEPGKVQPAERVIAWVRGFANPNGAIAEVQTIVSALSFEADADSLERAIGQLGQIIGAESLRPDKEYGQGPDNLWLWPAAALAIEVKNEAKYKVISRGDAGQLHISVAWVQKNYPGRDVVPMMVVATATPDEAGPLPKGTRLISPERLERLVKAVEGFVGGLVAQAVAGSLAVKTVAALLGSHGLDHKSLVQRYAGEPKRAKSTTAE